MSISHINQEGTAFMTSMSSSQGFVEQLNQELAVLQQQWNAKSKTLPRAQQSHFKQLVSALARDALQKIGAMLASGSSSETIHQESKKLLTALSSQASLFFQDRATYNQRQTETGARFQGIRDRLAQSNIDFSSLPQAENATTANGSTSNLACFSPLMLEEEVSLLRPSEKPVESTNGATKAPPTEPKATPFSRLKEKAMTWLRSSPIQDPYTAKHHEELVASLPSKKEVASNDRTRVELDALATSYYAGDAGYLPQALERGEQVQQAVEESLFRYSSLVSVALPIVRYSSDLPVALPTLPGKTHKGFIFAGRSPQRIHDSQARKEILNGNYVRCNSTLEVAGPRNVYVVGPRDPPEPTHIVDVIITGTTEPVECKNFKNAFLTDVAALAARKPIDLTYPYSDTPVFHASQEGIKSTGDLTNMPEHTKEAIRVGNFTACHFVNLQKTRLSSGSYKKVGAIAAGTTDDRVCDALHTRSTKALTDRYKEYKNNNAHAQDTPAQTEQGNL